VNYNSRIPCGKFNVNFQNVKAPVEDCLATVPCQTLLQPPGWRWMRDAPRTGCARRNMNSTHMSVARISGNRVISSGDLYCCFLPLFPVSKLHAEQMFVFVRTHNHVGTPTMNHAQPCARNCTAMLTHQQWNVSTLKGRCHIYVILNL